MCGFARRLEEMGYHVAVTTPYVLTQATKTDWTAYLNRAMLDLGAGMNHNGCMNC